MTVNVVKLTLYKLAKKYLFKNKGKRKLKKTLYEMCKYI